MFWVGVVIWLIFFLDAVLFPGHEITALRLGRFARWVGRKFFSFTPLAFCDGARTWFWVIPTETTLRHERHHLLVQAAQLGVWGYRWRYLKLWREFGYQNHPMEIEARKAAGENG